MVSNSEKLKQFKSRLSKLNVDLEASKDELIFIQDKYNLIKQQIKDIKDKIKNIKKDKVILTEHALFRYIERFYEIDINKIKDEILSDKAINKVLTCGDGTYPLQNGMKIIVKNNTIVTIIWLYKEINFNEQ